MSRNSYGCLLSPPGGRSSARSRKIAIARIRSVGVAALCIALTTAMAFGQVADPASPVKLGVTAYDADSPQAKRLGSTAQEGVFIARVFSGNPGAEAGLQAGDVVIAYDGRRTLTFDSLTTALQNASDGEKHRLTVVRDDRQVTLSFRLSGPGTAGTMPQASEPVLPPMSAGHDTAVAAREPYLGIRLRSAGHPDALALGIESPTGAAVIQVTKGAPAARAGLQRGDLISQFGDREIETYEDLESAVARAGAGTTHRVIFIRGNRRYTTNLTLGSQPAQFPALSIKIAEGVFRLTVPGRWVGASIQDSRNPSRLLATRITSTENAYELLLYHASNSVNSTELALEGFLKKTLQEHSNGEVSRFALGKAPTAMVGFYDDSGRRRAAYRISFVDAQRQYFIHALAPPLSSVDRLPPVLADVLATIEFSQSAPEPGVTDVSEASSPGPMAADPTVIANQPPSVAQTPLPPEPGSAVTPQPSDIEVLDAYTTQERPPPTEPPGPVSEDPLTHVKRTPLVAKTLLVSTDAQTVEVPDRIKITIAGGLLAEETQLSIAAIESPPPPAYEGMEHAVVFDVSLGNLHEFEQDIAIEIPYQDDWLRPDCPPWATICASRFDKDLKQWMNLPCEVDMARKTVRITTHRLSLVSIGHVGSSYNIKWDEFWEERGKKRQLRLVFLYNRDAVWQATQDYKAAPATPRTPKYPADAPMPEYVEDITLATSEVIQSYGRLGFFPVNEVMFVYIQAAREPSHHPLTGNLLIPTYLSAQIHLRQAIAHELFHNVQLQHFTGRGVILRNVLTGNWWLEATAEYAASRIAVPEYPRMGQRGQGIPANYLTMTLDWAPGTNGKFSSHQYHGSHFLDFLVRQGLALSGQPDTPEAQGKYFAEFYNTVSSASLLTERFNTLGPMSAFVAAKHPGLKMQTLYERFAVFFLFNDGSPVPPGNKSLIPLAAASMVEDYTPGDPEKSASVVLLEGPTTNLLVFRPNVAIDKVGPISLRLAYLPPGVTAYARVFKGGRRVTGSPFLALASEYIPVAEKSVLFAPAKGDLLCLFLINHRAAGQYPTVVWKTESLTEQPRIPNQVTIGYQFLGKANVTRHEYVPGAADRRTAPKITVEEIQVKPRVLLENLPVRFDGHQFHCQLKGIGEQRTTTIDGTFDANFENLVSLTIEHRSEITESRAEDSSYSDKIHYKISLQNIEGQAGANNRWLFKANPVSPLPLSPIFDESHQEYLNGTPTMPHSWSVTDAQLTAGWVTVRFEGP